MDKKPFKETKLTYFVVFTFKNFKNKCDILLNKSLKEIKPFKNKVKKFLPINHVVVVENFTVSIKKSIKHVLETTIDVQVAVNVFPFVFGIGLILKFKYKDQIVLGLIHETLPGTCLPSKNSSWETFEQTQPYEGDLPWVESEGKIETDEISGDLKFQLKGECNKNTVSGLKPNLKRVDFYNDFVLMQIDSMLEKHQNQLYTGFILKPRTEKRDSLVLPHTNTNSNQISNFKVKQFRDSDSEYFKICGRQLKPVPQSLLNHIQLSLKNIEQLFLYPKQDLGWVNKKQNRLFCKNWVETRLDNLDELPLKLDQSFNYSVESRPFDLDEQDLTIDLAFEEKEKSFDNNISHISPVEDDTEETNLDKQNLPINLAFEEKEKSFDNNISHISPIEDDTEEIYDPENEWPKTYFKLRDFEKQKFFETKDLFENEIKDLYYNVGISPLTLLQEYKYSNQPSQDPVIAALIESTLPKVKPYTKRIIKYDSLFKVKKKKRKVEKDKVQLEDKKNQDPESDKVKDKVQLEDKENKDPESDKVVELEMPSDPELESVLENEGKDEKGNEYNLVINQYTDPDFETILDFLELLEEIEEDQFVDPDLNLSNKGILHKNLSGQTAFQTRSMSGYQFPDMISDQVFDLRNRALFQSLNFSLKKSSRKSKVKQDTALPIRIKLPPSFLPTSVHKLFINPVSHLYPFFQPTTKTSPRENGGIFWTEYDKPFIVSNQAENKEPRDEVKVFGFSQNRALSSRKAVTPFSGGGYRKLSKKETGFNPFSMHLPYKYRDDLGYYYPEMLIPPKRTSKIELKDKEDPESQVMREPDEVYSGPLTLRDEVTVDFQKAHEKVGIGEKQLYWSDNPLKDHHFKSFAKIHKKRKSSCGPLQKYSFKRNNKTTTINPFLSQKFNSGSSIERIGLKEYRVLLTANHEEQLLRNEKKHDLPFTKHPFVPLLDENEFEMIIEEWYRSFKKKEAMEEIAPRRYPNIIEQAKAEAEETGIELEELIKLPQEQEFELNPPFLTVKVVDKATHQHPLNDLDYQPLVYSPNKKFYSFSPRTFQEIQSNYNFPPFNSVVRPVNTKPLVNNLWSTQFHYPFYREAPFHEFMAGETSSIVSYKNEPSIFGTGEDQSTYYQHWESSDLKSVFQFTRVCFFFLLIKFYDQFSDIYAEELLVYLVGILKGLGISEGTAKAQLGVKDPDQTYRLIKRVRKQFKDLLGINDILPELSEIVWFLRNFGRPFEQIEHIPKGLLLVGPTGTGKTLLVQALAGEAGVSILSETASSIKAIKDSNRQTEYVKFLFQKARLNAPCVFFIDEIDALGYSRDHVMRTLPGRSDPLNFALKLSADEVLENLVAQNDFLSFSPGIAFKSTESFVETPVDIEIDEDENQKRADKRGQLQLQPPTKDEIPPKDPIKKPLAKENYTHLKLLFRFLIELDGIDSTDGIFFIAATNRPEVLDPALTRPGRLDRVLHLGLPGKSKRIEILKFYSQNIGIDNISWNYLAQRTLFLSPADIAAVMNESAIQSIVNHNKHTLETIEKGIQSITNYATIQPKIKNNSLIRIYAFYQAGKAVCNRLLQSLPLDPSYSQQTDGEKTSSQSIFSRASLQGTHKYVGYAKQGVEKLRVGFLKKNNQSSVFLDYTAQEESTLLTDQIHTTVLYLVPKLTNPRYTTEKKLVFSFAERRRTRFEVESYLISLYAGKAGELLAIGGSKPGAFKDLFVNTESVQTVKKQETNSFEKPSFELKPNSRSLNKVVEYLQNQTSENQDKPVFLNQDLLQSTFGAEDIDLASNLAYNMVEKWSFYSTRVIKRKNTKPIQNLKKVRLEDKGLFKMLSSKVIPEDLGKYKTDISFELRLPRGEQKIETRTRWQVGPYKQDYEKTKIVRNVYSPEDWNRLHVGSPIRTEHNSEYVQPDRFSHTGEDFLINMMFQGQKGLEKPCLPLSWIPKRPKRPKRPTIPTNGVPVNGVPVPDEKELGVGDILNLKFIDENFKIVYRKVADDKLLVYRGKDIADENISQNQDDSQSDPTKGNTTDMKLFIEPRPRIKIKRQRNVVYTENWVQSLDNSKIPDALSVTWNDMHKLDRDFLWHALILTCFNTTISILDDNREILDFFADYFIRFKIVRPIKVFEIFDQFGYSFSNDQKD